MTERGQPPFDSDEEMLIRNFAKRLRDLIQVHLESPALNRESVSRFCEVVKLLEDLAHGRPQRLKEYLEMH
jgi:hypothetical protein